MSDRVLIPLPGVGTLELPREVYERHLRPIAAPATAAVPAPPQPARGLLDAKGVASAAVAAGELGSREGSPTVVRGTPVNHISSGGAGINPGKPAGMVGTVKEQYDSDRRGYQSHPNGGTPYQSDRGNPGDALRIAEGTGRYGVVLSENGQDHNDPKANGSGAIFDKATEANGYTVKPAAPTLDSPVPRDAPVFDPAFIEKEDRAHMGEGRGAERQATDDIISLGGVMSR